MASFGCGARSGLGALRLAQRAFALGFLLATFLVVLLSSSSRQGNKDGGSLAQPLPTRPIVSAVQRWHSAHVGFVRNLANNPSLRRAETAMFPQLRQKNFRHDYRRLLSRSSSLDMRARNLFTGVGLLGKWSKMESSYVLRPQGKPKSVIFFLGGAFVGAAPQQWYRYFLEEMAREGHVVVATPYQLSFNYLKICKYIAEEQGKIYEELAEEYGGDIPVVGAGHSAGALLTTMLSTPIAKGQKFHTSANVLISFNNKPVKDAIPAFESLVIPVAVQLTTQETPQRPVLAPALAGPLVENIQQNLKTAEALGQTGLLPPFFERQFLPLLRQTVTPIMRMAAPAPAEEASPPIRSLIENIQRQIRVAEKFGDSGLLPPIYKEEIIPFLKQTVSPLNQLPPLFEQIASGVADFTPATPEIHRATETGYRTKKTLLVQFTDDNIDETDIIGGVLKKGGHNFDLQRIDGTHLTPCTQDLFFETPLDQLRPPMVRSTRKTLRENLLAQTRPLTASVAEYLEQAIEGGAAEVTDLTDEPPVVTTTPMTMSEPATAAVDSDPVETEKMVEHQLEEAMVAEKV